MHTEQLTSPLRVMMIAAFTVLSSVSHAQTLPDQNATNTNAEAQAQDRQPPLPGVPELESLRPGRVTLLREGSSLRRARGTIHRSTHGTWLFRPEDQPGGDKPIELHLLPSQQLMEMGRLNELGADAIERSVFEITGDVFVYRGHNYLLASFAPRLIGVAAPVFDNSPGSSLDAALNSDATASDSQDADQADTAATARENADDSIEQIKQELEEAVGAVPQAARGNRTTQRGADGQVRDGQRIINRRGRVRRDERGAWVFVFDADASGLEDPPMRLLPCLLLEDLVEMQQTQARATGARPVVLITGMATSYRGRSYLLPSMYRIPRHGTPISH